MKKFLLLCLTTLVCSATWAYSNAVDNEDGVTIYYDVTSSLNYEAKVTYKDETYNSYSGEVVIPETFQVKQGLIVTIDYSVIEIGEKAFYLSTGLTSVTLPSTIATVSTYAFGDCTGLTKITVLATDVPTCAEDAFSGVDTKTCVLYVPDGCKEIYAEADVWKDFSYIVEMAYVEEIPKFCVDGIYYQGNSPGEHTVEVTWGGEEQGQATAEYTGEIIIPETVDYEGTPCMVTGIGNFAFEKCELTSISIPSTVTYIGENALYFCTNLTEIDVPESVATIGQAAFTACSNLAKATIKGPITSLNSMTFSQCTSLPTVTLPSTLETIGSNAFFNCTSLTSIDLPSSLKTIEGFAFMQCTSLESVDIPNSVTSIGQLAFSTCESLAHATLPEGLTTLEQYVFYHCHSLSSIELPQTITSIGSDAFAWCWSLTSIDIPVNVKSIELCTFYDCESLTSVTLPEGLLEIGVQAFKRCTNLPEITIPSTVTTLYMEAFTNCENLTKMTSLPTVPPSFQLNAFTDMNDECVLYVPKGSKSAYESAEYWQDFYEIREIGGEDDTDGINGISVDSTNIEGYYSIDGQQLSTPQEGVNIVRYSDGTSKKVLMK